ncbi:MAG: hypothetical protein ABEI96_05655 [Haloarculaceae archaeon]
MTLPSSLQDRRTLAVALALGAGHAAAIAGLVVALDYPIDALRYAPGGPVGALVGLLAAVAVPAYATFRYRLATPLLAALASAGWPVYRELTTPPPTFSTLGGYTVVEGTRYVDAYVDGWYVWLFVSLLLGGAEYVARIDGDWLPDPVRGRLTDDAFRGDTRSALRTALVVAGGHVAVFLLLAADSGYFAPGGFLPSPWYVGAAVLAWTVAGLALVGGVPAALLVRGRLVTPVIALAWLVRQTGWRQNVPLPDDPLPVYFIGWVFFLGVLVGVGAVEYAVRTVGRWAGGRPTVE